MRVITPLSSWPITLLAGSTLMLFYQCFQAQSWSGDLLNSLSCVLVFTLFAAVLSLPFAVIFFAASFLLDKFKVIGLSRKMIMSVVSMVGVVTTFLVSGDLQHLFAFSCCYGLPLLWCVWQMGTKDLTTQR